MPPHFPVPFPENWRIRVSSLMFSRQEGLAPRRVAFPTLSNFARRHFSRRASTGNRVSLRVAQPRDMKDVCTFKVRDIARNHARKPLYSGCLINVRQALDATLI